MDNKHTNQQQQQQQENPEQKEKLEEALEIHNQSKPTKIWNTITAPEAKPLSEVFIDLVDMSKVATKKGNANYNFWLVAIDVYSRRGWIEPIKNKTTGYALEGLKKIFTKEVPERITSDNGGEFKGQVAEYFRQNNIEHRPVQVGDHRTMGIIDRFIRTIRNELNLIWEVNENFNGCLLFMRLLMLIIKHITTQLKPCLLMFMKGLKKTHKKYLSHTEITHNHIQKSFN